MVSQKLLPLVVSCRYDAALVVTVLKILVILTKPMSETAKNAGRLVIDARVGKTDELYVNYLCVCVCFFFF